MEKLLRPEEVADALGIELSTVYNWTHKGKRGHSKIPYIKVGGCLRFKQSDIEKWLNEPKPEKPKKPRPERPTKTGSKKRKNPYIDSFVEQAKSEFLA